MKFISTSKKGKTVIKVIAIVLAILFIFTTVLAALPIFADDTEYGSDKLIRVGIYYEDTAVSSVALASNTGFDIGYFDSATKTFSTYLTLDNNTIIAYSSTDTSSVAFMTPEYTSLYVHGDMSPVYVRARSGAAMNIAGNVYSGIAEFSFMGNVMQMVNIVYLEDYIKGVVVSEIFSKWPAETLKAQAIVARSFTLYTGSKHAANGFDICAQAHCQAYKGIGATTVATNQAVDDTRGLIVTYDGKPALTTYHSASGPTTESAANAWGSNPENYPYLSPVDTSWFNESEKYTNGLWSYTVSASELTNYINSKTEYAGILKSPVESVVCESRGNSSYVYKITITDTQGNSVVAEKSTKVRTLLSQFTKSPCFKVSTYLPVYAGDYEEKIIDSSNMYVISADGEKVVSASDGKIEVLTSSGLKTIPSAPSGERVFTISGEGYGHGVGMSQYGAMTLAEKGYDFRYILSLYYPGTEIVNYNTLG